MTPDDQRKIDRILRICQGGGTVAEAREVSGLSMGQARRVGAGVITHLGRGEGRITHLGDGRHDGTV